jgi:S-disulfanyl-L-cysteine oxidoreductase SoxD
MCNLAGFTSNRGRKDPGERNNNKPMKYFRWKQVLVGCIVIVLCGLGAAQTKGSGSGAKRAPGGFSAQAKRGHEQYVESCAVCHAEDLSGLDPAPPLTGETFMKKWQGKSLWDLYDKIRKTMPQQDKGSLSPKTYLEILAYLAKFNAINTGAAELKSDPKTLKSVVIRKPGGKQQAAANPAPSM